MNNQSISTAYLGGYLGKQAGERHLTEEPLLSYTNKQAKKDKPEPWNTAERQEFETKHGKPPKLDTWGVSFGKDKQGYFVYTHRARSSSKTSPAKITKTELDFVRSTG